MEQKKVFHNAKWIIVCKAAQALLQLVVGMLCARYLGPANYGIINYAASIVSFVLPLMKLGLDSTLVHELIAAPEKEGEIMGTSLLMNLISSAGCCLGIAAFVSVVNAGDPTVIWVCILYSLSIFFTAIEMMQYWFQYRLLSKYSSIVMLISYGVASLYKILLLAGGKSVFWFALTNSLDFGIIGFSLLAIYRRKADQALSVSWERVQSLFRNSRYYIFASLMVVVYHHTDHIMITTMIGNEENGFYSAAITCATIAQFVYNAIIDSFRPLILSAKKENSGEYETHVARLYGIITYATLAQSLVFTLFARRIIRVLYGAEYAAAVPVLQVLVWYLVFSVMGTVRNVWILAEGKQKYLPWINLTGAVVNIVLNFFFIRLWGAWGAALASFLTQFFTNFILGFCFSPMRQSNRLLLRGIHPGFFFREVGGMIRIVLGRDREGEQDRD